MTRAFSINGPKCDEDRSCFLDRKPQTLEICCLPFRCKCPKRLSCFGFKMATDTVNVMHCYLSDQDRLSTLLVFVTGLDEIPALGFEPTPSVTFGHAEDLSATDLTSQFPVANTCSHQLRLPVLATYDEFANNMTAAIEMSTTFTLA